MPPLPPRNALILPSTIRPPPRTTLFPYTTLFRSMIYSLPSFLRGHVTDTLTCTRVMAGPETIKAGFLKERDVFGENGITYCSPFVTMGEPDKMVESLYESLKAPLDLGLDETKKAVDAGYRALNTFNEK